MRKGVRTLVVVSLLLAGLAVAMAACGEMRSSRVRQQKNSAIAAVDTLYQFGCDPDEVCGNGKVVCGGRAERKLGEQAKRGGGVVVRHYSPLTPVGHVPAIWVIENDASGTYFWDHRSDVAPCEECGWHKREFEPGQLRDDGAYLFRTSDGKTTIREMRESEDRCAPDKAPPGAAGSSDAGLGETGIGETGVGETGTGDAGIVEDTS